MKLYLIFTYVLIASAISGKAEELRFVREEVGTGLMDVIVDSKGVETYIRIDDNSDAKAVAVWAALIDAELYGTAKPSEYNGLFFDQPIIFAGVFTSEVLHTPALHDIVPSQPYRVFKVTSVKIGFPFTRIKYPFGLSPSIKQSVLETHFGFETLFPKGIKYNGKKLDLTKYKREPSGEKAGDFKPAARPEPKREGSDKPQPEAEGRSQYDSVHREKDVALKRKEAELRAKDSELHSELKAKVTELRAKDSELRAGLKTKEAELVAKDSELRVGLKAKDVKFRTKDAESKHKDAVLTSKDSAVSGN